MSSLNLIWIWDGVTLLCVHPYSLWEGKDWMTAVYFSPCTHQKSTKALLKWRPGNNPGVRPSGGHHPRALCSCQEPFTPSRFSPNGTSESIKTIITAIPESKEIILGCQGKHGKGVWSYLLRNLLDMHLARQAITASISGIFVFFFSWSEYFADCCIGLALKPTIVWGCGWRILMALGGLLVGNRNLCLCWMRCRRYQQPCFYSHHSLMNGSQDPLNISSVKTSIVSPWGQ